MISGWILLTASLLYVGALFAIAWWGDRSRFYPENVRWRPVLYSLALAVYCSSWTFYGAVGTGVREGFAYLPVYLGPVLLFLFGHRFFERLVRISKQQKVTAISDLFSARFGRAPHVSALVTVIALTGAIPYIGLQLRAIDMSVDVLLSHDGTDGEFSSELVAALLLAVFAILFGTRAVDATEHHRGMVLAIAAESAVKLIALTCVGLFAWQQVDDRTLTATLETMVARTPSSSSFVIQTLVSLTAAFCLTRQFQIGVVECADANDVRHARWLFPGYLLVISALVIPIAAAALQPAAVNESAGPDSFVLWLPAHQQQTWLALLVYLGGVSAATGMVIVASIALATMVCNDIVLPAVWRMNLLASNATGATPILWIRRSAILFVLLAAYAFVQMVPDAASLASIGLLAFAAAAQFAPGILAAVYWPGASRAGVVTGLAFGFAIWIYTLLVPTIAAATGALPEWISAGPFGMSFLAPHSLFGFRIDDAITHGVCWSLFCNVGALLFLSWRFPPPIGERLHAATTAISPEQVQARAAKVLPGSTKVADLMVLASRFLGAPAAERLLVNYSKAQGRRYEAHEPADLGLLHAVERELASALGYSSARMVLTSTLRGSGLRLGEVVAVLDEASQKLRFNRELVEAVMHNMPQGISVVDADMRLVAWNQLYLDLFQYPPGFVHVGRPIADLIRFNAERGWCGPGDPEQHVARRLDYMRAGSQHVSERRRADGRVIQVRGQPLPDGGFVMTFNDVTAYKRIEDELREVNETLEERVRERTRQLETATAMAQQANLSKTRFVAAASHDLLQPLNAARLFLGALRAKGGSHADAEHLAARVDDSLHAAEGLLTALLDISRLDQGAVHPVSAHFPATELLESLEKQFAPIAAQRGLTFRAHRTRVWTYSDQQMLRRVLQNFLSNALRYTRHGGIVLGCRSRSGRNIEFVVYDTGPGIAPEHQQAIFDEFHRLEQQSPWGEQGLGLGLSICDRMARVLRAALAVKSRPGCGSAFGIVVPRGEAQTAPVKTSEPTPALDGGVAGMRVLCIDDEHSILEGMRELLQQWNVSVFTASNAQEATALAAQDRFDVVLADYQLQGAPCGLDLLESLVLRAKPRAVAGALVTADKTEAVVVRARTLGFQVLHKPVRPAALRALLAALAARISAQEAAQESAAGESA